MLRFSVIKFVAILLVAVGALTPPAAHLRAKNTPADYDTYEFTPGDESQLIWYESSGTILSTGRPFVAHTAIFHPSFLSFYPPIKSGCFEYWKTSKSSSENYDCEYATNGGFFVMGAKQHDDNLCIGNLVGDGTVYVYDGMDYCNFGITADNRVVMGYLDDSSSASMNFTQLLSGRGWLVRNGKSAVANSTDLDLNSQFVLEKAPRTAVGLFPNGTAVLFEVDGEEDIEAGPDLYEMAELLVDIGIESAVNLDGGGSSVSVHDGEVVSAPTCADTSVICEREVQSIACVRRSQ